jgi:Gluconate 2-dehydrogenase subunit 3
MPSTKTADRRAAIHALLQGGLALSLMPGFAESAWSAVAAAAAATGERPAARVLHAQIQMVALIADTILPRSDTPGAIDVGVPSWINLVLAEYFSEARRAAFLDDLNAVDRLALAQFGARIAALKAGDLARIVATLDASCGSKDLTAAQRGYVQLKELVIVGYFTSKTVQQDLLKVVILPGRFDGDVPMTGASIA